MTIEQRLERLEALVLKVEPTAAEKQAVKDDIMSRIENGPGKPRITQINTKDNTCQAATCQ